MQVQTNMKTRETMQCALNLTANARNGIVSFFDSEQAFFSTEKSFVVSIEKRSANRQGNLSFSIYFDNVQNENLSAHLNARVAVMECVIQNDGFLATGFRVRGRREPVVTNRRHVVNLKFILNKRTAAQMPIELYTALRELPIAEERSEYVKKRIASWEGYLRIQEMNADVEDITTKYKSPSLSEDFSKVQLICQGLNRKALRKINGFSAKIEGISGDIGNVTEVNPSKNRIEIELSPRAKNEARRHALNLHEHHQITFNNFAELSQVRRLRAGFKNLQDGLAANANLERILFEERPVVQISNVQKKLDFHSRLNQFQEEAVTGAMNAHDLYVIQGPPGTGKTTVIAEICYQNAKAGLRTLVASQANLAVDNALGRLLDDQDIRILRYGRTESIEEEGKKFIEENVAHYWKEQTMSALVQNLKQHQTRKTQLEKEHIQYEQKLASAYEKKSVVEDEIEEKKRAQTEQASLAIAYEQFLTRKKHKLEAQTAATTKQEQAKEKQTKLEKTIAQLEKQLIELELTQEEIIYKEELQVKLEQLRVAILYKEALKREERATDTLLLLEKERVETDNRLHQLERFLEATLFISKLVEFKAHLSTYEIELLPTTLSKIDELENFIMKVKELLSNEQNSMWAVLEERLQKAVHVLGNLLKEQKYSSQLANRYVSRQVMAPENLNASLNRTARFLQDPETKKFLANRSYSPERYDGLERLARAYAIYKLQRDMIRTQHTNVHEQRQMIDDAKKLFLTIKKEAVESTNQLMNELTMRLENIAVEEKAAQQEQIAAKEKRSSLQVLTMNELETLESLRAAWEELQSENIAYEEKQQLVQDYSISLTENKDAFNHKVESIKKNAVILEEQQLAIAKLTEAITKNEGKQHALSPILTSKPEEERVTLIRAIEEYQKNLTKNEIEQAQLPMKVALQKQWLSMLENATAYDLEEIKKLYIEHANVIGTTCVASARRDFMEDYPTFDVVIIDEVSKATPPELLLPMLKGKKIILVGDHHQLPPLIGQETMEEFLEETSSSTERKELEELLKESLFERLFRTLPKQNKTMLAIQYRMHEKIMDTITPFYNEENYELQCGIEDSDMERNHLLESQDFNEKNHLLWFDIPNEKPYFEARVKGGTSRYNEAELTQIRSLLIDLNEATERAIAAGKLPIGEKKKIGVISFYGEQVKRIDRLIQHELQLPHLHCRTGSVDKFQGMEMDIIILSFVRNHDHPRGDIGFAQDYRRLNVALSRARELLMIVGSAEMFTKRPKNNKTKKMFTHLLEQVKEQNGWIKLPNEVKEPNESIRKSIKERTATRS